MKRSLCWMGWHEWVYRESGCTFHLTGRYVRTGETGIGYYCLRCGIRT